MRRNRIALLLVSGTWLLLVAAWFVLNHYRVQFYNSAMDGPSPETSPYWAIVRAQDILQRPIFVLPPVVALSGLYEAVRAILFWARKSRVVAPREPH
jgi:hypothetical protein